MPGHTTNLQGSGLKVPNPSRWGRSSSSPPHPALCSRKVLQSLPATNQLLGLVLVVEEEVGEPWSQEEGMESREPRASQTVCPSSL